MNYAVSKHLALPLESLATLAAGTVSYGTMEWSRLGVNVCMRIQKILILERWRFASFNVARVSPVLHGVADIREGSVRSLCSCRTFFILCVSIMIYLRTITTY